ncbi:MAG: U32 family peptidase, partial [Coriobacteriaceae bacterium]|nr:U32 family peptidase [Coriobacteriaceae bacterium]
MTISRKKPELLAPAGGMEQLHYAIRFGADAVYLGADRFGLRQRANNFSLADIPEAVAFAHQARAKVFVTCNAYMNTQDLADLPAYLEAFAQAEVDGLIASDMAVFRLARKHAPSLALHVSTQASCSNAEAALLWQELGAKRIVCAREMSLEDIALMRQALPRELELEVFVQGAMCMAISGRCLISDFLNDRSANQGHCTQPCRWEYALEEETRPGQFFPIEEDARGTYLMNSKDLCMLEHLDSLVAIGVDSLKIEGRNKKAFYVATVVNAYRQVLDGADPSIFLSELDTISHRPYSTGFFFGRGEQSPDSDAYAQTYDWVAEVVGMLGDGAGGESGEGASANNGRRVEVICRNRFFEGDTLEVLSPHQKIKSLVVTDLRYEGSKSSADLQENSEQMFHVKHSPSNRDLDANSKKSTEKNEPNLVASRAMERYSFATELDLKPFDMLRV